MLENRLSELTAPASEPISLSTVKRALRIDHNDDDVDLQAWISESVEYIQAYTGRQMITAQYTQRFDAFPLGRGGVMRLLRPPLATVEEVRYRAPAGAFPPSTVLSTTVYEVVTTVQPGYIRLALNQDWPSVESHPDSIEIDFTSGTNEAGVEKRLISLIKMFVAHRYENRDAYLIEPGLSSAVELPMGIKDLLDRLKLRSI